VTRRLLLAAALLAALAAPAAAKERVTVGVFAPCAPFDGPVARLDLAAKLATHLAPTVGASSGVGRAYGRVGDFAAAVKAGELDYAIVDAPYLAALGVPYKVIGAASRGGATAAAWELVTTANAKTVLDLKGKTLILPDIGARKEAFLTEVLLGGELPIEHFGQVTYAPDALSALGSLGHGRADAALVPVGLSLPAGATRVTLLGTVPWPVLVALPGTDAAEAEKVAGALAGFSGDTVVERLARGGGDAVRSLAGRFGHAVRRGPLAVPALRLAVDALVAGRTFTIVRPDPASLISAPPVD
jgi:hypothetical protein